MRFLVIGLGSIGTRHAKNLVAMGHEVVGYDRDPMRRGLNEISSQPDLDGVHDAAIICSPTEFHSEHIKYAAERGWHIFVEKPIALAHDNFLEQGLELARKKNLAVMAGNNLRFHGCVKKAKRWMDIEAVGHPIWAHFVVAQLSKKETYLQDGVISNWGAHELDLARYLLGECMVLSCVGNEKLADIILRHTNGCQTVVHLDYLTEPEVRGFSIVGSKGVIAPNLTTHHIMLQPQGKHFAFSDTFDDNYKEEMQAFIDRINGKQTLGATGEDGLQTLKLIQQAKKMAGLK